MPVPLGMQLAPWICRAVFVLVVSVVNMQMGMFHRLMKVHVFVVFRQVQPDAYNRHPRMTFR